MMNKDTFRIISLTELVLLGICFAANIYGCTLTMNPQLIFNMVAVVFAFIYLLFGCKKSGSLFFKLFVWFLAFKEAYAVTNMAVNEEVSAIAFIFVLLCFTTTTIIAFSLNLGRTKSFVIVGVHFLLSLVCLVYVIADGGDNAPIVIYNATRLLLSTVLGVLIYAKYEDKQSRGSK